MIFSPVIHTCKIFFLSMPVRILQKNFGNSPMWGCNSPMCMLTQGNENIEINIPNKWYHVIRTNTVPKSSHTMWVYISLYAINSSSWYELKGHRDCWKCENSFFCYVGAFLMCSVGFQKRPLACPNIARVLKWSAFYLLHTLLNNGQRDRPMGSVIPYYKKGCINISLVHMGWYMIVWLTDIEASIYWYGYVITWLQTSISIATAKQRNTKPCAYFTEHNHSTISWKCA